MQPHRYTDASGVTSDRLVFLSNPEIDGIIVPESNAYGIFAIDNFFDGAFGLSLSGFRQHYAGNGGGNVIAGTLGGDDIEGGGGDDALSGGGGADRIGGGLGNDFLPGGDGSDSFIFNTALSSTGNVDEVADFDLAEDLLTLDSAVFTGLSAGSLASSAFTLGYSAMEASHRIIYDDVNGSLWFDEDGAGGAGGIQFAMLDTGLILTESSFLVI